MTNQYIGYIRVSNKDHDTSLPAQRAKLKEFVQLKGLDLIHTYEEEQSAFGKKNRKVFDAMIKHLKKPEVKGVIFHKVDRSARNMKDFSTLETFFDTKDIVVIEGEFNTKRSQGRFMFRTFCNMAVWYSENLSEEVTTKMHERLKAGYFPHKAKFGYRDGTKEDPDPKKKYPSHDAKIVKEAYRLYDSGRGTYYSIAKMFRDKGIKMNKRKVERMITDPYYAGTICWTAKKTGKKYFYKGNHKPLVSQELWDRCKARREERTTSKGRYGVSPYSKLFKCGCDRTLCPELPTKNGTKTHIYLRCHNRKNVCPFNSIRQDALEDLIVEELSKLEIDPKFFKTYQEAFKEMNQMIVEDGADQRKEVERRLQRISQEEARIRDGFVQGVLSAEDAKEMRIKYEAERTDLTDQLNQKNKALDEAYFQTAQKLFETFKILSGSYKNASDEIKCEVLNLFFSNRTLKDGRLLLEPTPVVRKVLKSSNQNNGWGGGIRTPECQDQNLVPYHLATPHVIDNCVNFVSLLQKNPSNSKKYVLKSK